MSWDKPIQCFWISSTSPALGGVSELKKKKNSISKVENLSEKLFYSETYV